mmetsp:Transcript_43979/g.104094  ORF Transcript_43979/g.104094 Transcript_43979/m.104094 type:complete len:424 (-) Transcript_43979:2711-3982(-)
MMMPLSTREALMDFSRSGGARRRRICALRRCSTCNGSLEAGSSFSTSFLYSAATSLFSLASKTFSKTPKGTTALLGVSTHSGRVLRTWTMLVLLAPKSFGLCSIPICDSGRHHLVNLAGGGSLRLRAASPEVTLAKPSLPSLSGSVSTTCTLSPVCEHDTCFPTRSESLSNSSGSKQPAKKTRRLRARTEMCASTSGASGVMTPTTPGGTSSSPLSEFASSTVGRSYTHSWTDMRSGTWTTQPLAPGLPAEMTCHMLPPPWARSALSSLRRKEESTNEHPPPRTSSSEKSVMVHFSGIFSGVTIARPCPRYSALCCMEPEIMSTMPPSARRIRSTTAMALGIQVLPTPLCASSTSWAQSRRQALISLASSAKSPGGASLPLPGEELYTKFSAANAIHRVSPRVRDSRLSFSKVPNARSARRRI